MSEPDTIQATVPEQNALVVSKKPLGPIPAAELSTEISAGKDTWNVPDYLNKFFRAEPEKRELILEQIAHEISAYDGMNYQDLNVGTSGMSTSRTNMAGGAIASILRTMGQGVKEDIRMALQYSKEDELVGSILDTKDSFFTCGFDIGLQGNDKKRTVFDAFKQRHQIAKVEQDAMQDWNATDNIVLIWSVLNSEVQWITSMAPDRCVYKNQNGQDRLSFILDDATIMELNSGSGIQYPDRWKEAARSGGELKLDKNAGDGWAIVTRARKFNGLARPRMRSVFFDLMLRDLLKAGEWACAMFLQSCIQHIKIGPADGDMKVGIRQGQKDYPLKAMTNALNLQFATPTRARRLITDATVSIEHVVPDVKIFMREKFDSCDSRIKAWGGVPDQLRTGEGDGYSQGFMAKTRFEADGLRARTAVEQALSIFFNDPAVRASKGLKLAGEDEITFQWNKQVLKDPKQLLEEIKFAFGSGGLDWRTAHELLGLQHDIIKARMIEQHKEKGEDGDTIWMPDFEAKQGLLSPDQVPTSGGGEPGRPQQGGPSGRRPRASALNATVATVVSREIS
jgi:hypothetical protein